MNDRVLLVDDEANVLEGYKRQLRKVFSVETALSGKLGLEAVKTKGPFAVIVSDLRMPGMDGIEFLSRAREAAPDTVRIMLTGFADVQNAVDAVNEGNIFRFLTKPCQPVNLAKALAAGVKQYRLVTAEKELLEQTLQGSIKLLTDLLSLLNPEAFGLSARITRLVKEIVLQLGWTKTWEYETAAMLSQIGWMTLSQDLLKKALKGQALSKAESELLESHPSIASDLVSNIPRMEGVAQIIAYQAKRFDGSGVPQDDVRGKDIPLGAAILKVVLDYDELLTRGESKGRALQIMKERTGWYDPDVLLTLETILGVEAKYDIVELKVSGLKENMILAKDVFSLDGRRQLLARGQELSATMIKYLRNWRRAVGVQEPIRVMVRLAPGGANKGPA
ncbi:MAG: response regulator [Deltaproteobacteria bacterium]|nr:response regulator [Deltaproteobacteria bacterium]